MGPTDPFHKTTSPHTPAAEHGRPPKPCSLMDGEHRVGGRGSRRAWGSIRVFGARWTGGKLNGQRRRVPVTEAANRGRVTVPSARGDGRGSGVPTRSPSGFRKPLNSLVTPSPPWRRGSKTAAAETSERTLAPSGGVPHRFSRPRAVRNRPGPNGLPFPHDMAGAVPDSPGDERQWKPPSYG